MATHNALIAQTFLCMVPLPTVAGKSTGGTILHVFFIVNFFCFGNIRLACAIILVSARSAFSGTVARKKLR